MLVKKITESSKYVIFLPIECFPLLYYSRNAYKQYESFANALTKLCFHYHQSVNTIKYSKIACKNPLAEKMQHFF
eukprot:UN11377